MVAHDAGAANHIFAWLTDMQPVLYLAGPAQALWAARLRKTNKVAITNTGELNNLVVGQTASSDAGLVATLAGAAMVITGTGWESCLEHDARKLARQLGIHSVAVIDHWTNYEDRFIRNGELVLPDEIWVSDHYAAEIARATFPTVPVVEQVNAYLKTMVEEVESRQLPLANQSNDRVLYVLEPIRNLWGELAEPGEFYALDYFMKHRHRASIKADAQIRLRPHPSDPLHKYDAWLARNTSSCISLDQSATLADAIAWSNIVAGCQTYAMVVALACGRRVISTIPEWAPSCVLPHRDINNL